VTDEGAEARRLLSVFRERPQSVDPARTEARRARALPRLRQHVAEVAARRDEARRFRFRALGLALAAAVTIVGVGLRQRGLQEGGLREGDLGERGSSSSTHGASIFAVEGHVVHLLSGARRTVSVGDVLALPLSGELGTNADSGATLETTHGLRLHLEKSSRLGLSGMSVAGSDRSVELHQGQLQCTVPKLVGSSHFSVVAATLQKNVHGTRFSVRVDSAEAGVTRTCVRVSEGVVAVRHSSGEAMLHAGDSWGCRPEDRAATAQQANASAPAVAAGRTGVARRAERPAGTLGEETALLQTALAAERKGQQAAATAALLRLVSRYPDSPLAPEARTILERVSREPPRDP